ncbi:DUF5518 domain-containing protein [Haloterrigena salifodinae]|uniref:DUF5518 domain-containing protein n=1 Tax=Haloterrigena salifodinae TaxID=2675099 RepID=UPI000F86A2CC|nr:DUF5518 domain-containing protein [Haloterrigena salifodinae]
MTRDRSRRSLLADDSWRYAIVGGLASLPFTTVTYWQTGSEIGLLPVVFGGLVAGYLYEGPSAVRSRVGFRAGLIGLLPALWMLVDILWFVHVELGGPVVSRVLQTVLAIVAVVTMFVFAGLAAIIGSRIGDWLSKKVGRYRPSVVAR